MATGVRPRCSRQGNVLFGARTFTGGALRRGIYLAHGGSTTRVAGVGDVMPDGWRYVTSATAATSWDLNNRGEVAFMAIVQNDAGRQQRAIYAGKPGALSLVARVGTVVPGVGGTFALPNEVNQITIYDRSDVVFVSDTLTGPKLVEAGPKA